MKRILSCFALLSLLLTGCAGKRDQTLVGTWVNAGQYADGKDFVETMILREDGTITVHLDYQGRDYATLEGTWHTEQDVLTLDFTDPNVRDRTYTCTLSGDTLILAGDEKTVEYSRK